MLTASKSTFSARKSRILLVASGTWYPWSSLILGAAENEEETYENGLGGFELLVVVHSQLGNFFGDEGTD